MVQAIDLPEAHDIPVFRPRSRHSGFAIRRSPPPMHYSYTTSADLLNRLNSWTQPGLYEREFRGLLRRMRQCSCSMIMVRDVFNEHRCEHSMLIPAERANTEV